jgi:hypothetical protein
MRVIVKIALGISILKKVVLLLYIINHPRRIIDE